MEENRNLNILLGYILNANGFNTETIQNCSSTSYFFVNDDSTQELEVKPIMNLIPRKVVFIFEVPKKKPEISLSECATRVENELLYFVKYILMCLQDPDTCFEEEMLKPPQCGKFYGKDAFLSLAFNFIHDFGGKDKLNAWTVWFLMNEEEKMLHFLIHQAYTYHIFFMLTKVLANDSAPGINLDLSLSHVYSMIYNTIMRIIMEDSNEMEISIYNDLFNDLEDLHIKNFEMFISSMHFDIIQKIRFGIKDKLQGIHIASIKQHQDRSVLHALITFGLLIYAQDVAYIFMGWADGSKFSIKAYAHEMNKLIPLNSSYRNFIFNLLEVLTQKMEFIMDGRSLPSKEFYPAMKNQAFFPLLKNSIGASLPSTLLDKIGFSFLKERYLTNENKRSRKDEEEEGRLKKKK